MPGRSVKSMYVWPFAIGYLCLHALSIRIGWAHPLSWSYPFLVLTPAAAITACIWRARHSGPRVSLAWSTIASGIALWMLAMILSWAQYLTDNKIPNLETLSGFLFFAYGIPILAVLVSPMEGERSPLFVWLDSLQAVCFGCLLYVMLFGALPFQPLATGHASSMGSAINAYNGENLFLALGATCRLFLHARSRSEGRMYWCLAAFLWVYGFCAAVNNYLVYRLQGITGYIDVAADVPFLVLMMFILSPPEQPADATRVVQTRQVAIYIDNASHIVGTLALMGLAAYNVRLHYGLGLFSIAVAGALYVTRATLLQNRLLRSQAALREAKERLEALSLEDPLTKLANRRCFDLTLDREWRRAARKGQPLTLMMIDLDHFKALNDRHGHVYGDECLVQVAGALRMAVPRADDLVARYGGEEFSAILIGTGRAGAVAVAERMLLAVKEFGVTVSLGIASVAPLVGEQAGELVESADRALYQAKQEGRDRFVVVEAV